MSKEYSLYEAKAKFSELVRRVREGGEPVTITVHGKPAVEIRPVSEATDTRSVEEVFADLEARGEAHLVGGRPWTGALRVGRAAPGGLQRFLDERR
ncbi:MAG: type II toxin-antitoxin system Phd/YefM family antitoxin [Gemmatimonadaceae bacterium]|nr:type II toxin-antitoxin system Phd/YefM family antitoxin [Gemmatimonadaceae bacterium]